MGPRLCVGDNTYPVVSRVQPQSFWIPAIVLLLASGGMFVFCLVTDAFKKRERFPLRIFTLSRRIVQNTESSVLPEREMHIYFCNEKKTKPASIGMVGGILGVKLSICYEGPPMAEGRAY